MVFPPESLLNKSTERILVNDKTTAKAAAVPELPRTTSVYTATEIVAVFEVYSIMLELNSLIVVIQLIIAPEKTPGIINSAVVLKKVRTGETPRFIEASSMDGSIWYKIADDERTVYGSFRIT